MVNLKKIYYFANPYKPYLDFDSLNTLGLEIEELKLLDIDEEFAQSNQHCFFMFDIPNYNTALSIDSAVRTLLENNSKVGIATDMQPTILSQQLTELWSAPTISHPFTPQNLVSFLTRVSQSNTERYSEYEITRGHSGPVQFNGHVLLVEDNLINQTLAVDILEELGLTCDIADDGQQAITKVVNSPCYDLVLMDVQMPVMDGYEATRELRRRGFDDLAICGLSANAMQNDIDHAQAAGMNDYVTKPIEIDALHDILAKYLTLKSSVVGVERVNH